MAEILAGAGYDWVLIDTEHSPNELPMVVDQLRALAGGSTSALVRPAWNDPVLFKRLLDVGAQTLLVPFVQNAEEASRAVAATRYPPEGIRGVASVHRANALRPQRRLLPGGPRARCACSSSSRAAPRSRRWRLSRPSQASTALFIGPSDLAASLGHLGNPRPSRRRRPRSRRPAGARGGSGKPIGILAPVEEDARRYLEMGFSYVAVGSDLGVLRQGVDRLRAAFATG